MARVPGLCGAENQFFWNPMIRVDPAFFEGTGKPEGFSGREEEEEEEEGSFF